MAAYFGRLRACTLTAASWLRLHVCPLGTLELEGVATAARAEIHKHSIGHLVDVAWHTILVLHLCFTTSIVRRRRRGGYTQFGSKRDPAA